MLKHVLRFVPKNTPRDEFGVFCFWVVSVCAVTLILCNKTLAQQNEPCPGNPAITCSGPLSVCGQWGAISQCDHEFSANAIVPPEGCNGDHWPWDLYAVHAALLVDASDESNPRAKILMFKDTTFITDAPYPKFRPWLWDPVTLARRAIPTSDPDSVKNIFCGAQVVLSDGRLLTAGGMNALKFHIEKEIYGHRSTFVFDASNPILGWQEQEAMMPSNPDMGRRYYPTLTNLDDGRVLVTSGKTAPPAFVGIPAALASTPEIYKLGQGWSPFATADNREMTLYPYMALLPGNGTNVLHLGPRFRSRWMQSLDAIEGGSPTWQNAVSVAQGPDSLHAGSFVIYEATNDSLKILTAGGFPQWDPLEFPPDHFKGVTAESRAETIAFDAQTGTTTRAATSPMGGPRYEHNLVVLPTGKVLRVGGGTIVEELDAECGDAVYEIELWDPNTGTWSQVAPMCGFRLRNQPRMYHSIAVLIPDGRIVSAGGLCKLNCNRGTIPPTGSTVCFSGDFYKPGYLFKADGTEISAIDRPAAINPPRAVAYGEGMSFQRTVGTGGGSICHFSFIRPAAVTHTNNMDQRRIPLTYTDGATLSVAPADMPTPQTAPPGYYMMFMVNQINHPSVADFVLLWGINKNSIQISSQQTCSGISVATFDVSWETTFPTKASDNNTLQLWRPGSDCTTDPPDDQISVSSSGTTTHTISHPTACFVGTWHYHVKSELTIAGQMSVSDSGCQSITVNSCPSCGGGNCRDCQLN